MPIILFTIFKLVELEITLIIQNIFLTIMLKRDKLNL